MTRCCTSCIGLTTRDPDFHDRRAKRTFARYGPALLLVAKFVPGLDAVAPPLAGTLRTSRVRFLALDAVGAALYACVYGGLGYVFSHDLNRAAVYVSRAGTAFRRSHARRSLLLHHPQAGSTASPFPRVSGSANRAS